MALAPTDDRLADHFPPAVIKAYMYRAALSGPGWSGVNWLGQMLTGLDWLGEILAQRPNLDLDADVHVDGWTMLTLASSLGHHQLVEHLLALGTDTETPGASGMTALGWACFNGHEQCVRTLLERGADLHAIEHQNHTIPGPDVGAGGCSAGLTSLVIAAKREQVSCMMLLLSFGAGQGHNDRKGRVNTILCPGNNFSAPVLALLTATYNQPALHAAAACQRPADARSALELGRIDTAGCSPTTMRKLAASPSPLGLGRGSEACAATTALITLVMARWSRANHMTHHRNFRAHVRVVLLAEHRLGAVCSGGKRRSARRGALPVLPPLMWSVVLSFLVRSDWPADPIA